MSNTLLKQVGELGAMQRHDVLPSLALVIAQAASDGALTEDDANDVYAAYIKNAMRVSKVDYATSTFRVNASKMRQVIKLGAAGGVPLLRRVTRLHEHLSRKQDVRPLYHAMVDAAREQLSTTRALTDTDLAKLIGRKKKR
jgi:hypothetical protein